MKRCAIDSNLWVQHFICSIDKRYKRKQKKLEWTSAEWTIFLGKVLDDIAKAGKCYVVRRRPDNKKESGEYLNIDGLFFALTDYTSEIEEPLVLPRVAVELENSYVADKIAYCLWKLMCIRTSLRVLICYQPNKKKVEDLKTLLQKVILKGKLMQGQEAEVLLIIGNENLPDETEWQGYYSFFVWRHNKFEQLKITANQTKTRQSGV